MTNFSKFYGINLSSENGEKVVALSVVTFVKKLAKSGFTYVVITTQ